MEKSKVYYREAYTQIDFAKISWLAFKDAEEKANVMDIFMHLQHFLSHAAMVDKVLGAKDSLNFSDVDLKPFRKLRNHLEHFDERLGNWLEKYEGHTFLDMNIVTGTKGFPS